jgi:predicted MFS family arabinose efflux permease
MMAALAVVVPGLGLPYRQTLLVVAVATVGMVTQGTKIVVDTALQVECADDFRGRVFSVNDTAFNLCFVGGLFLGALVLPADGHSPGVLVAIAAVYAAVAVWYAVVGGRHARSAGDDIQVAARSAGLR